MGKKKGLTKEDLGGSIWSEMEILGPGGVSILGGCSDREKERSGNIFGNRFWRKLGSRGVPVWEHILDYLINAITLFSSFFNFEKKVCVNLMKTRHLIIKLLFYLTTSIHVVWKKPSNVVLCARKNSTDLTDFQSGSEQISNQT